MITRATRVRWHPDTLFRNLDGEAVLLGGDVAEYYGLDPVGTRVWELVGEHGSVDAVVAAVLREFEVGEAEALADVVALVEDLLRHGLVEVEPG
ncbi:MAG: PqqD family protein [Myxococcota bacterium]